jgi:hypothetical protein
MILNRSFLRDPDSFRQTAQERGMTLEELAAEAVIEHCRTQVEWLQTHPPIKSFSYPVLRVLSVTTHVYDRYGEQ